MLSENTVMEGNLHSSALKLHMGHSTLQHDNDPKQVNVSMATAEKSEGAGLTRVSLSPDLNITEPLWGDLKRVVLARQPKNVQELETCCQKQWAA